MSTLPARTPPPEGEWGRYHSANRATDSDTATSRSMPGVMPVDSTVGMGTVMYADALPWDLIVTGPQYPNDRGIPNVSRIESNVEPGTASGSNDDATPFKSGAVWTYTVAPSASHHMHTVVSTPHPHASNTSGGTVQIVEYSPRRRAVIFAIGRSDPVPSDVDG